ncbi:hypothetical protein GDO86_004934, partial [Hymenochirus boettgeri]
SSKATSAASKTKVKSSKAERLRVQREEEEKRLREEEEARFLAEQAEAEQREKERLEQEERERLEAKQLQGRTEELEEYQMLVEDRLRAADKWKAELRAQKKWDRYMLCDGSPDPTVTQEINTFLSLWAEEMNEDFQSVLQKSSLVLSLIEELETLLCETPAEELPEKDVTSYKQTILQLQQILPQKLNEATEHLLKNAKVLSDIETGNMQKVINSNHITSCIWANLNKNPRFKGYDFSDEAIGFELPKPLAMSNIAVRIIRTDYDHLSWQSQTFSPHVKEMGDLSAGDAVDQEDGAQETAPVEEAVEITAEDITVDQQETKSEGRKGEVDALDDDIVDLRQFSCLGGVYYLDVLSLPPQCKQVNGWCLLQLVDGGLQNHPYPQESFQMSLGMSLQEKELDSLISPPVGVYFRVSNHVVFFEEPEVARWDPTSRNWSMDVITQKKYNPEQREISFKMDSFYTFALFQDSHLNMPYQYWELNPKAGDEVALTIVCAFTELLVEMKGDRCRLSSVSNTDCDLSWLTGKWMTPLHLKSAMKSAGLNVFPAEDSGNYVSVNKKSEQVEITAYKEIALLSSSFAFGWSKWNHSCGFENVVIKVKEQKNLQPAASWALYMLSPTRSRRLKISESSGDFSDDLYDRSEFHSTLYHMVKDYSSPETMEMVKDCHHLFVDCVYQILNMTKVLTFS